ncbi:ribonucleoside-diphosphate reductase subunit alpha [Salisediminibacterium halotolerans]|uniref:Ribonucleoside-diphosphate reductase n=1 Tax=Salisediminibacterium halotolerans TaxID=517425 RepID=A0A1H9SID1_9BACI|nr:ribonucleoside-diphosphate reductase subunit alpha [Salisediminibacterium haloalkalitolerans]SER84405.1 ribonucleoside-diphosphate reductase alpha chain [Salisediminibacterium haloalkalitolerans]
MVQVLQGRTDELKERFPHLSWDRFERKAAGLADGNDQRAVLYALDEMTDEEADWTYVAAAFALDDMYQEAERVRGHVPYQSYPEWVQRKVADGRLDPVLTEKYSADELAAAASMIEADRDLKFTYIGLKTLADRYLLRSFDGSLEELPQERWLTIALILMQDEAKDERLGYVREAYWALSNLYMTVATPTLANAGKTHGQLSSCFIDTVDDDLRGIFDSNTDAATVSKNGGGLGLYLGKIRSRSSSIRGHPGVSSGVIPWMKQLNNTAVSVDQLGQRQGAIAVYLDVWHKDIFSFLDAKLNNGDERQRTHDLFTGVTLPDLFMEKAEAREPWYLFDPHEVREVMGFSLEDAYDEEIGAGSFREKYEACVNTEELSKDKVEAIDILKRIMVSQLETGTPYMFYRDTVNRLNANNHAGMIYGSNLCTEITQNMSPTVISEEETEDGQIKITKDPGDYVVCNLSSISLASAVSDNVLERLIPIQVRMLDNVIDVNQIPVPQAKLTNGKYRPIGLGTFGWHHLLAKKKINWESEEAVSYADELYEQIHYLTLKASAELAEEKGAYSQFAGSDFATGAYFSKRGLTDPNWQQLQADIQAKELRNGYLMAVAPNASTSLIAGSSASIDPIFKKMYAEEKKNFKIPVTAPELSAETTWYYKPAHLIDQHWSIRQNAKRQKHIDQAISFNLYVPHSIKAKELLDLHLDAWKQGLKTTYYVRSTSTEIEDCDSCSS